MDAAEFDKFCDEYYAHHAENVKISGESPEFFAEYKIKDIAKVIGAELIGAERAAKRRLDVLDFGGGIGASIPHFHKHLPNAHVTCLDVSAKSLALAEARFGKQAAYVQFDGRTIPFADDSFDVTYAACVFHHIAQSEHDRLLEELRRVTKRDGHLFVYEHNPLNPLTVRLVNTCPFDENAVLIRGRRMLRAIRRAGFTEVKLRYRLFFPRFASVLRPLEHLLYQLPLGGQYYVVGTKG